jgi:hypothetical protein
MANLNADLWRHITQSPADAIIKFLAANANLTRLDVPNSRDSGRVPLHVAIVRRLGKAVVTAILDRKANIDYADSKGITPLHIAAGIGAFDIVELLLERNASVFLETKAGASALSLANEKDMEKLVADLGVENTNSRYNAQGRQQAATRLEQHTTTILARSPGPWGFSGVPRNDGKLEAKTCFWGSCEASSFEVRQLGYANSKRKAPSERSFYDVYAAEFFRCPEKMKHVAQFLTFPDLPHHATEYMTGLEGVPKFFVQQMMIPDYEPPNPVLRRQTMTQFRVLTDVVCIRCGVARRTTGPASSSSCAG